VRNIPEFFFGKDKLDITDDYIYLGSTFNYNGKFQKAIAKQVAQAKRALFGLRSKALKLNLPIDIQFELFEQLIVPILLYGSEIWGFQNVYQLEIFYRSFIKRILHLNKGTPNCIIYGETGTSCLANKIHGRMINFWVRLLEGKQNKLSVAVYKLTRKLYDNNIYKSRWLSKIQEILDRCGLSNVWDESSELNGKWIVNSVRQRLLDSNLQNWNNDIFNNSKCVNYRIFKDTPTLEKYLYCLDPKLRINLCKFRCANAKLPVYTYRTDIGQSENSSPSCSHCDLKPYSMLHKFIFRNVVCKICCQAVKTVYYHLYY